VGKAYTENPSSVFPHTFIPSFSSQSTALACVKQGVLNHEGKELLQLLLVENDLMSSITAHFHDTRQVTELSSFSQPLVNTRLEFLSQSTHLKQSIPRIIES